MKYPKLFHPQPKITKETLSSLEDQGLIVPAKTLHKSKRRIAEITNPTAGEVVGYNVLAEKLKNNEIDQYTARILLVIEATREKGPRETHLLRLINTAFATDKTRVLRDITTWVKNQK